MHAGRTQTVLKVRYKGHDRIVEPYSLKYLEKKDGDAREYFYVYNRSGGESEPDIRSFLPERLESIENTEEKFTPQYQIELSKAGEMPENRYLFDPNRPTRVPRARVRISHTIRPRRQNFSGGLKYVFNCSTCGKQFTRSSFDSSLNPHKGKSGYPCYGTYGVYKGTKY
jgi:hypothetical protein